MKYILNLLLVTFLFTQFAKAQETPTLATTPSNDSLNKSILGLKKDIDLLKNLKISGWVQAQFQVADTNGTRNFDGGDFPGFSNNRFMIRRGRIKFTYTQKNSLFVFQLNATERGANIADLFAKVVDPWTHGFSLTAGVMNRPFGYDIQLSSVDRESPERARWTQMYLPNERDMGAMISFQPQKGKPLYGLKIDAGYYNGTGIAVPGTGLPAGSTAAVGTTGVNGFTDFDSYKDFISHIVYYNVSKNGKIKFGIGASYYNGGFVLQNNKFYTSIYTDTLGNKVWKLADTSGRSYKNTKAPRVYYGFEALLSINSVIGTTTIRGEYFTGTQTGRDVDSRSPQATPLATDPMFLRNFSGGYVYFIQRIGKSKHELAFKYEWMDPNTKISAPDLNGLNGMKQGELKYTMMGVGYNIHLDANIKLMFHYNLVSNEVAQIKGFTYDLKDNVFTARLQYRF